MYKFKETKTAFKDWDKLRSMSKAIREKFKISIVDILENPRNLDATGNPKELKHRMYETYSRRLSAKDHIVFEIHPGADYDMPEEAEIVVFLQYLGHYEDK